MPNSQDQSRPVTRRGKRRWFWLSLLAVVLVAGGAYALVTKPWEPKPRAVAIERVMAGPVSQVLALNGRVAAKKSVTVRAAVSAQALTVGVQEGESVAEGDVLAQLDTALVEAQLSQARSALDAQQAKQRQAQAAADRAKALGENASRSTLEDAELALSASISETARLEAALEQVEQQLAQYRIVAPMSGTILARGVDEGQLVDAQTELFVIADTSELVVETDVDEIYSSRVHEGLPALLKPVGASVARPGMVVFAAPTVDSATGGRAIKIGFDEPVDLPVGLTVNANVIVEEVAEALSVPRGAIVTEGAQSHVLTIRDGVAVESPVVFDDWPAERVIVTEGLAAGDVVILDPAAVAPGDMVVAQ